MKVVYSAFLKAEVQTKVYGSISVGRGHFPIRFCSMHFDNLRRKIQAISSLDHNKSLGFYLGARGVIFLAQHTQLSITSLLSGSNCDIRLEKPNGNGNANGTVKFGNISQISK